MHPLLAAAIVIAVAYIPCILLSARKRRQEKTEGVNIAAGSRDIALVGPVSITLDTEFSGTRSLEGGRAVVRYDTTYDTGKPKVRKYILSSAQSYFTLGGHFVVYHYFRADGKLEREVMVYPQPGMSAGVQVVMRTRLFAEDETLQTEFYERADRTLGVRSDEKTGLFQIFRRDGKTLQFEQHLEREAAKVHCKWYRLDGKTVWYEKLPSDTYLVHFDHAGQALEGVTFEREKIGGSISMGPETPPIQYCCDKYKRADGTASHKQHWYKRIEKATGHMADALGAVIVHDTTGERTIAEYELTLTSADRRYVKVARHYDDDGGVLIREYRAAGKRLSETRLDSDGKLVGKTTFPKDDSFTEPSFGSLIFQGFDQNIWGEYDTDSHDI